MSDFLAEIYNKFIVVSYEGQKGTANTGIPTGVNYKNFIFDLCWGVFWRPFTTIIYCLNVEPEISLPCSQ